MLRDGDRLLELLFKTRRHMRPLIHFLHGKESGPWGSKITYLAGIVRELGFDVESLDYSSTFDPSERVRMMAASHAARPAEFLVGSSMGGWVAATASAHINVRGVFLLAPAFYLPGYPEHQVGCPGDAIEIVHGWRDSVVPFQNSVRFGLENRCTVHFVDDEHRLRNRLGLVAQYLAAFLQRLRQA